MKNTVFRLLPTVVFMAGVLAIPQLIRAESNVDVLISCPKPYKKMVSRIEAAGGKVRYQYEHIDAIAATVPRDRLAEIQSAPAVKAFVRDLIFSLEEPPAIARQGFDQIKSRFPLDADALSGDMVEFVSVAPDGYFPTEAGITRAVDFWNETGHLGEGVIVGIMDSGTAEVAAISGRVLGGESFLSVNPILDDGLGPNDPGDDPHGTWVATTLGANAIFGFYSSHPIAQSLKQHLPEAILPDFFGPGIDGVPMVGQAPLSEFYALRVFNVDGQTSNSVLLAAFDRAIELKEDGIVDLGVLNGSFGGASLFSGEDPFFAGMMAAVQEAGIVTCFSAGNEGPSGMTVGDPALARNNLAVGATSIAAYEKILIDLQYGPGIGSLWRANDTHQTAFFSSRGPTPDGRIDPDITAPGDAIFAQGAGWFALVSGTSFSAPMVAGGAALLLSAHPDATPDQIRAALLNGANPDILEDNSGPLDQGFGFLDVLGAHAALLDGAANPDDGAVGKRKVQQNIQQGAGIQVIHASDSTASTGALLPGERAEYFLDIKKTVKKITVTISNVTPELSADQQNPLWGDDLLVAIHSAKTSGLNDYRFLGFVGAGGATFVLEGSDLDLGIARITISGDWINAGKISAEVNIRQEHWGREQGLHAKGLVGEGDLVPFSIDVPEGASELRLRLAWDDDWGSYPTDDLDLLVFDPDLQLVLVDNDGDLDLDGFSLDVPERLSISDPAAGEWFLLVSGFTVWEGKERFGLYAEVLGSLPKLASEASVEAAGGPGEFALTQNTPNPFNPATQIAYQLPQAGEVSLVIYNLLGQPVRVLAAGHQEAGYYQVTWDGKDDQGQPVANGSYLYRLSTPLWTQARSMLLLK